MCRSDGLSEDAPLQAEVPAGHATTFGTMALPDPESLRSTEALKGRFAPVTKIPAYVSEKMKVLLFAAITGAVAIHCCTMPNGKLSYQQIPDAQIVNYSTLTQTMLVCGMLRSCVPMCFVISGLLFFVHRPEDEVQFQFWRRISARARSIGLPYLLWNMLGMALVYLAVRIPTLREVFNDRRLEHPTWHMVLLEMWDDPAGGQLWYLRDLLLLTLLTPLLHRLFKVHHSLLLLVPLLVAIPWLTNRQLLNNWCFLGVCPRLTALRNDGAIFFPVGCYLALRGVDLERRLPSLQLACLCLLWLGLCVLRTVLILTVEDKTEEDISRILVLRRLIEIPGVAAMWFGYDLLHPVLSTKSIWPWISWLSNFSMWIYCFHHPLINLILAVPMHRLEHSSPLPAPHWWFGLWLSSLAGIILLALAIGVPLSRYCPTAYGLLTGGRG